MRIRSRKSATTDPNATTSPIKDLDPFVNASWVSNLDEMYNVAKPSASTVATVSIAPASNGTVPLDASAPIAALISALAAAEAQAVAPVPAEIPIAAPALLAMVPPPPAPPAPIAIVVEPVMAPPAPPAPVPAAPVEIVVANSTFDTPAVAEVVMFDEFLRPRRH